ncbi:MAG: alpha-hydroxy-acid oxidizing enzyme [Dehalococcoidia bacterium]
MKRTANSLSEEILTATQPLPANAPAALEHLLQELDQEFPTYAEILAAARRNLPPEAWNFLEGGAGDEVTVGENRIAFQRLKFRPRLLTGVLTPSTATTVLGHTLSMPLLTAPFGLDGVFHPDGHIAVARANRRMGTMSIVPIAGTHRMEEFSEVGVPRLFQFHPMGSPGTVVELIRRAEGLGYSGFCVTLDCPVPGWRERQLRDKFTPPLSAVTGSTRLRDDEPVDDILARIGMGSSELWTWRELEDVCRQSSLPFLFKGITTRWDALRAVEAGASAILVSNHGGRHLDTLPPAIDQLEEVVAAVGPGIEVLLDSGVRRGADIVKAIALGARAVVIGRPAAAGIAAAGEAGAYRVLELLQAEMVNVMTHLGSATVRDIRRDMVERR